MTTREEALEQFRKQFPSIRNAYGRVHYVIRENDYHQQIMEIMQKHCVDKQRVKELVKKYLMVQINPEEYQPESERIKNFIKELGLE